jgi:hypothetical protein
VFLPFLFHYLLEFLVIVFEVDAIVSSCLNSICSSSMLICMFSLVVVSLVMFYQLPWK